MAHAEACNRQVVRGLPYEVQLPLCDGGGVRTHVRQAPLHPPDRLPGMVQIRCHRENLTRALGGPDVALHDCKRPENDNARPRTDVHASWRGEAAPTFPRSQCRRRLSYARQISLCSWGNPQLGQVTTGRPDCTAKGSDQGAGWCAASGALERQLGGAAAGAWPTSLASFDFAVEHAVAPFWAWCGQPQRRPILVDGVAVVASV